jgi:hypothetical protein
MAADDVSWQPRWHHFEKAGTPGSDPCLGRPAMRWPWAGRCLTSARMPPGQAAQMRPPLTKCSRLSEVLIRNPCNIAGAGQARAAERPFLSLDEVTALAEADAGHLKTLVVAGVLGGRPTRGSARPEARRRRS